MKWLKNFRGTSRKVKKMIGGYTREKYTVRLSDGREYGAEIWSDEVEPIKRFIKHVEEGGRTIFLLPVENARFTKCSELKHVAPCAYNATNEYMKKNLGKEFEDEDRKWYQGHPLTIAAGLPENHTFGVIQALIRPYGLGISKVFFKKGLIATEENKKWLEALSVNPLATDNRFMSNQDYLDTMSGGDPEMMALFEEEIKDYNFEYVDTLPGPAVRCEAWTSGGHGSFGGHASYIGPRQRRTGDFQMGYQVDFIENCKYKVEPPCTEYDKDQEAWVFDFGKSIYEGTTTIDEKRRRESNSSYKTQDYSGGYGKPSSWQRGDTSYDKDYVKKNPEGTLYVWEVRKDNWKFGEFLTSIGMRTTTLIDKKETVHNTTSGTVLDKAYRVVRNYINERKLPQPLIDELFDLDPCVYSAYSGSEHAIAIVKALDGVKGIDEITLRDLYESFAKEPGDKMHLWVRKYISGGCGVA